MYFFQPFIDKFTTYKIRILSAIKEKNDFVSVKELSNMTGLSVKTIDVYINSIIEDYLKFTNFDKKVSIVVSPNKKIMIYYSLYEDYTSFILFIFEQCYSIQLLTNLFLGDRIVVLTHLSDFFVSNTTFKRQISKMRPVFKKYQIEIKNHNGLVYLSGDEKQIRMLAYTFFWSLYKGHHWPFHNADKDKLIQLQEKIFPDSYDKFGQTNKEEACFILAINRERSRNKYSINYPFSQFFSADTLSKADQSQKRFELESSELLFFIVVLQTQAKIYSADQFRFRTISFHQRSNTLIHQSITSFFKLFSKNIYPIPKEQESFLYPFLLANHLFCKLFKNFSLGITSYPEMYSQKEVFPLLEKKLALLIDQLYVETENDLFKESEFLISRYALLFSTFQKITYFEIPISVYIDTDLSLLAENKIINQLHNHFDDYYNLNIYNSMNSQKNVPFDLVITSSFLSTIPELSSSGSAVIFIAKELHSKDLFRIDTLLRSIRKKKNLEKRI